MWPFRRGNKEDGGGKKAWKAKLDDNPMTMYYNKELKCWVEKGKEEEMRKKLEQTAAPPPTAAQLRVPPGGGPPGAGSSRVDDARDDDDDILGKMLRAPTRSLPGRAGASQASRRTTQGGIGGGLIPGIPGANHISMPSLIPTPGSLSAGGSQPDLHAGNDILPAATGGPSIPTPVPVQPSVSDPTQTAGAARPAVGGGRSWQDDEDEDEDLLGLKVTKKKDTPRLVVTPPVTHAEPRAQEQGLAPPLETTSAAATSQSHEVNQYKPAALPPTVSPSPSEQEMQTNNADPFGSFGGQSPSGGKTAGEQTPPGYEAYTAGAAASSFADSSQQEQGHVLPAAGHFPPQPVMNDLFDPPAPTVGVTTSYDGNIPQTAEQVPTSQFRPPPRDHRDDLQSAPDALQDPPAQRSSYEEGYENLQEHSEQVAGRAEQLEPITFGPPPAQSTTEGEEEDGDPLEHDQTAAAPVQGEQIIQDDPHDSDSARPSEAAFSARRVPPPDGYASSSTSGAAKSKSRSPAEMKPSDIELTQDGENFLADVGDDEIDKYTVDENHEVRLRAATEPTGAASGSHGEQTSAQQAMQQPISISVTGLEHQIIHPSSSGSSSSSALLNNNDQHNNIVPNRGGQNVLDFTDLDITASNYGSKKSTSSKLNQLEAIPDDELEERVKSLLAEDRSRDGTDHKQNLYQKQNALHTYSSSVYYKPGGGGGATGGLNSATLASGVININNVPGSLTLNQDHLSDLLRAPPNTTDLASINYNSKNLLSSASGAGNATSSSAVLEAGRDGAVEGGIVSSNSAVVTNEELMAGMISKMGANVASVNNMDGMKLLEAFDEATRKLETLSICSDPIPDQSPLLESPDMDDDELPPDHDWLAQADHPDPDLLDDDANDGYSDGDSVLSEAEYLGQEQTDPRQYLNSVDLQELQRALKKACQLLHKKDAQILELQTYTKQLCEKFEKQQQDVMSLLEKNVEKERNLLQQVQEQEQKFRDRVQKFQAEAAELRKELYVHDEAAYKDDAALLSGIEKSSASGSGMEDDDQLVADGEERKDETRRAGAVTSQTDAPPSLSTNAVQLSAKEQEQLDRLLLFVSKANLQEAKKLHRTVDLLSCYGDKLGFEPLVLQILTSWCQFVGPFRKMKAFFVDFGCVEACWETMDKFRSNTLIVGLCLEVLWHLSYGQEGQARFPTQPVERLLQIGFRYVVDKEVNKEQAPGQAPSQDTEKIHQVDETATQHATSPQIDAADLARICKAVVGTLANLLQAGDMALLSTFLEHGGISFLEKVLQLIKAADFLRAGGHHGKSKVIAEQVQTITQSAFHCLYLVSLPVQLRLLVIQQNGPSLVQGRAEKWASWCAELYRATTRSV
ncbi:unnamed protein product [Amoebophrya sp. A120]|nr:unnamed protein product [Amoebophrya sp. A120]|eukprot:GSA120T00004017001.1